MRRHRQLVLYQSILQVLHETGCPFCRLLKEFQADRLQKHAEGELHHLCNFHAWGLAAVQDAPVAARIFLRLVDEAAPLSNGVAACDVCDEVVAEEDLRIREFGSCLSRSDVSHWLRTDATLCIPHAMKLRRKIPLSIAPRIDALIVDYRKHLAEDLQQLRDEHEPEPDRTGWGAVGRAAEFLVSQRGLRA
jgi:hypothetical protein